MTCGLKCFICDDLDTKYGQNNSKMTKDSEKWLQIHILTWLLNIVLKLNHMWTQMLYMLYHT